MTPSTATLPAAICRCGCGGIITARYTSTDKRYGKVQGEFHKYLSGHQFKSSTRRRWARYSEAMAKQLNGKKICSWCGEAKVIDDFYPSKFGLYRVAGRCKSCCKQTAGTWQKERPEWKQRSRKSAYERVKGAVFDHYGRSCKCCGESEPMFLSIDHVNNDGGGRNRQDRGYSMYRDLIMRGFPDTYQVLCWNCNVGKQRNGGTCPHIKDKYL